MKRHRNRLKETSKLQVLTIYCPTDGRFLRGARVGRLKLKLEKRRSEMKTKKNSTMAICLAAILAFSPVASFAQATITFSGEAVALRASALGISLALSDTGALPSSGGDLSTSLARGHVFG